MSRTTITKVYARQIYSGRGHPGVEATVVTENGSKGVAVCTSGISIGSHEVQFSFDNTGRFGGKGVMNAVDSVNNVIAPAILGLDASLQKNVDYTILGITENAKQVLGGNAVGAVSAAVLKAGAAALDIPLYQHIGGVGAMYLPVPGVGVADGSDRYGGGITTPGGKPSITVMCYDFSTFSDASYAGWEISMLWQQKMRKMFGLGLNGHGSITIPAGCFNNDDELWELIAKTIIEAGYEGRCGIQIDVATDTYHNKEDDLYYGLFSNTPKSKDELFKYYQHIVKDYPVVILEDPFNEDDYDTTAELTKALDIQIVGDDLFTTNPERVAYGISKGAATTVLLKVNQIGSITEAMEMIQYAYMHNYSIMPCSSRGEGSAIADYCVGINASTVRESAIGETGNRFLQIESELGSRARFTGRKGLKGSRFSG